MIYCRHFDVSYILSTLWRSRIGKHLMPIWILSLCVCLCDYYTSVRLDELLILFWHRVYSGHNFFHLVKLRFPEFSTRQKWRITCYRRDGNTSICILLEWWSNTKCSTIDKSMAAPETILKLHTGCGTKLARSWMHCSTWNAVSSITFSANCCRIRENKIYLCSLSDSCGRMARSLAVTTERLLKTNTCRDAVRAAWISCISATRFSSAVYPTTTIQNAEETIRSTAIGRIHSIGDNIYKAIATSNTTTHCHLPTSVRYATSGTSIIQMWTSIESTLNIHQFFSLLQSSIYGHDSNYVGKYCSACCQKFGIHQSHEGTAVAVDASNDNCFDKEKRKTAPSVGVSGYAN